MNPHYLFVRLERHDLVRVVLPVVDTQLTQRASTHVNLLAVTADEFLYALQVNPVRENERGFGTW